MHPDDLLLPLTRDGSFPALEDAQRATLATFETLGYALPVALLRELSALLPRSYVSCLWLGPSATEAARRLAHALPAWNPTDVPPPVLEDMQRVCAALAALLPPELVQRVSATLPPPLAHLFRSPARPAGNPKAGAESPAAHVAQHQDHSSS